MYGSIHTHFESDKDASNVSYDDKGKLNFVNSLNNLKALGAKKVAVTEHGVFSSFEDIYADSKKVEGIDVIPGCEIYLEFDGFQSKTEGKKDTGHMILIAKNMEGYKELCRIITDAAKYQRANDTKNPLVTLDNLKKNVSGDNLICTTACIAGPFGKMFGLYEHNINKKIEKKAEKLSMTTGFSLGDLEDGINTLDTYENLVQATKELYNSGETPEEKKANRKLAREQKKQPAFLDLKKSADDFTQVIKSYKLTRDLNAYKNNKKNLETLVDYYENDMQRDANNLFNELHTLFGENLYFEVQNHGIDVEETIYNKLVDFAKEKGITDKFIASNDIHILTDVNSPDYLDKVEQREVLKFSRFNTYSMPEDDYAEYGIKDDDVLREKLLEILPEDVVDTSIKNIENVLSECKEYEPSFENHYPKFAENDVEIFRNFINEGIMEKFGGRFPEGRREEYKNRLKTEVKIIESMGYVSYHLIVKDYLEYGRLLGFLPEDMIDEAPLTIEELEKFLDDNNIERVGYGIGPGRGSAVGSLCCYLLGITDIDPIPYDLLFERFLNPERTSMPDIDSDFRTDIRDKCQEYVSQKYGANNVCKIMTKSYTQDKGNIRLACRFLAQKNISEQGLDEKDAKQLEKHYLKLADKLTKGLDTGKYSLQDIDKDLPQEEKEILHLSNTVDGTFSAYGQHAAGVIISKDELQDIIPLSFNTSNSYMQTQCDMATAESKGLLKMDFLGLSNLDFITKILKEKHDGKLQDYSKRNEILQDKKIFETVYQSGNTVGIFQFESEEMTKYLMELEPDCFEDLIAMNALYRPGPKDFIPEFIENKKHPENIKYLNDIMKEILQPTYGIIVYQEQVMQIFQKMAGYSLGGADLVRRAMSKKHLDELTREEDAFIYGDEKRGIEGCIKKANITKEQAKDLFDSMLSFAEYAFNKSHATAYALVSFYTAYLKTNYPLEFYLNELKVYKSSEANLFKREKKFMRLMKEMNSFGITLLPPDMTKSQKDYSIEGNNIRFGLSEIKNIKWQDFNPDTCLVDFMKKNPNFSIPNAKLFAKLGLFDSIHAKDSKKPCIDYTLDFIESAYPLFSKILKAREELAILENNEMPDAKKISKLNDKIEDCRAQYKEEALYLHNKYLDKPFKPAQVYSVEKDLLGKVFSINEEIQSLRDRYTKENSDPYNDRTFEDLDEQREESRMHRIPCFVTSISEERFTKTTHKRYFQVDLVDMAGNQISRRFDAMPSIKKGIFEIQDNIFFFCKEPSTIDEFQQNEFLKTSAIKNTKKKVLSVKESVNERGEIDIQLGF